MMILMLSLWCAVAYLHSERRQTWAAFLKPIVILCAVAVSLIFIYKTLYTP